MAITSIKRDEAYPPFIVRIVSSDTIAQVGTAGYLTAQADEILALNNGAFDWEVSDMALVYASDGWGFFQISSDFASLTPFDSPGGAVDVIGAPVVIGDFAVFQSTTGNIEDLGYLPSDAAETVVVMQDGAAVIGNIPEYDDVSGTLIDSGVAVADLIPLALPSGEILVGDAGGEAAAVAMSGDIAIDNAGVTSIAAGVIVNADVSAAAAIDYSKLAALPSGEILVGSAGNVATAVAMSGDATISNTGALTIAAGAVDSAMLNENLLRYAAVTMSAAQFNGAFAAPHLLVAAPGANELLVLEGAYVLMTYGTTQFANGGVAHIQYDDTASGAGVIASSTQAAANFFDAASTALYFNPGIVKQPFATAVNTGLYFSNITGAFDTGDSDFVVHIWYRVIPTV